MDSHDIASVAKALAHPARVRIVRLLAVQTQCRGADLFGELDLAQSTVSEHVRVLKEAGVVTSTPLGAGTAYCLCRDVLSAFARSVEDLAAAAPVCLTEGDGCD